MIRRTLKTVLPHARELGAEEQLAGIEAILRRGNAADRQLRTFNANRDVVEVVRDIADVTEAAASR
jgi:gamma-glutamyl:cysteine ligase YbdK (ATP-grasp superfamily)